MRPDALEFVEVATGKVLDTVSLTADGLAFATGAAGQMFAVRGDRFGWTAEHTYDQLNGWSNGYAAVRPAASPTT